MQISNMYKKMFEALRVGGIEAITKTAYNIMEMPITITDMSYTVIGLYPQIVTGDEQWDTNHLNQQIIAEAILAFQSDEHWRALRKAGGSMCIDWGYCTGRPRYSALIEKNGKLLGCLAFLIGNKPKESWHLKAINIIAEAAGIAMEHDYSTRRDTIVLKEVLMKSLITGSVGSHKQFLHMADIANFMLQSEYVLVGVAQRDAVNELFSNYIDTEIFRHFPDSLQIKYQDLFYILMDGNRMSEKERIFIQIANEFMNTENIAIAFSNVFRDPLELEHYKWQVDSLLNISAQAYENETIFHYGDFVTDIAMKFVAMNISGENLLHPMLKKLKKYDKEHQTDYFNTLKIFVQSFYNKNDTSNALNIHRNTLFYRLEKIHEMTGLDIRDHKTANHLLLSFYYLDTVAKSKDR